MHKHYLCAKFELNKSNLDIPKEISPFGIVPKIRNRLKIIIEESKLRHLTTQWQYEIDKREEKFEEFINLIPQTTKMNKDSLYNLNQIYDIFICGSDQIWNPNFFDGRYMLDFVVDGKKKVAFSPSFGTTCIPTRIEELYKQKLSNLDAISVREDVGCEMVQELTHRKALHLCDPTLLLSSDDWIKALQLKHEQERYILCYFLDNNKWYLDMLTKVQEYLELPIKIIGVKELSYTVDGAEVVHPGPIEFVQAIANASFVITDSFHGMLFSTNFNREYMILQRFSEKSNGSENNRLKSFMRAAKLEERYYSHVDNLRPECFQSLNESQMRYIETLRKESIQYLHRFIDEK